MRLALLLAAATALSAGTADTDAFAGFRARIDEYLKLHEKATAKAPKLKDKAEPEEITRHEQTLAKEIRAVRKNAKQGDIFTKASAGAFIAVTRNNLNSASAREAVKDDNPVPRPVKIKLAPNVTYPKELPVSTVPPAVLLKLPKLPEDLEYRFVGRALILHDRDANLIIDYLPEAAPPL